jgi:peptidoglycan/LPS O-acetylase OafA/YrhL
MAPPSETDLVSQPRVMGASPLVAPPSKSALFPPLSQANTTHLTPPDTSESPVQKPSGQSASVDPFFVFRGFAAGMVLLSHIFPHGLFGQVPPSGPFAVWLFFVLSGYLMGKGFHSGRYQLSGQGIWNYLVARASRIAPLYYTLVALDLLLWLGMDRVDFFRKEWAMMVSHWIGMNFIPRESMPFINGALWSVSTECQFYLMAPVAWAIWAFLHERFGVKGLLWSLLGLYALVKGLYALQLAFWPGISQQGISLTEYDTLFQALYFTLYSNLPVFLAGFTLNYLFLEPSSPPQNSRPNRFLKLLLGMAALGFSALSIAWASQAEFSLHHGQNAPLAAAYLFWGPLAGILIASTYILGIERRWFSIPVNTLTQGLNWLGKYSYGIYVLHILILRVVSEVLERTLPEAFAENIWLKAALILILTLTLARLSYQYLEEPLRKWMSRSLRIPSKTKTAATVISS